MPHRIDLAHPAVERLIVDDGRVDRADELSVRQPDGTNRRRIGGRDLDHGHDAPDQLDVTPDVRLDVGDAGLAQSHHPAFELAVVLLHHRDGRGAKEVLEASRFLLHDRGDLVASVVVRVDGGHHAMPRLHVGRAVAAQLQRREVRLESGMELHRVIGDFRFRPRDDVGGAGERPLVRHVYLIGIWVWELSAPPAPDDHPPSRRGMLPGSNPYGSSSR